jgi:hypothetical protein
MTIERCEVDQVPEADPLRMAIGELIGCIFTLMPTESDARAQAIGAVVELHGRIAASLNRRALN